MAIDKQFRDRCENPNHYDRMIKLVASYSTAAKRSENPEEWATDAINHCISQVTSGGLEDCATGCVMALRTRDGRVRLFLEPLLPIHE
jgi:hypothetical protein